MEHSWSVALSNLAEASEKAVASATEFSQIATRAGGLLARRQLAAFEDCLDAGSKHLQVATHSMDPAQAVRRHAAVVVELGDRLVAAGQESVEIQVQARDNLLRWCEESLHTIVSQAGPVLEEGVRPIRRTRSVSTTRRQTTRKER